MTFKQSYTAYKDLVYNLALQYLQNTADAEEITQDVFLSVYQNLSKFEGKATLKTWIYRITINKSLDFIKAKSRNKRSFFFTSKRLDNPDTSITVSHFDHPGILLERKEEMESIFACINALPERQKTALILMKIENRTQQEAATIMKSTVKSVESLYQRAKRNLKKQLALNEGK